MTEQQPTDEPIDDADTWHEGEPLEPPGEPDPDAEPLPGPPGGFIEDDEAEGD